MKNIFSYIITNNKMPVKNMNAYENYIYKIFKRDFPTLRIKKKAIRVMDDLISQIFVDIKKRSLELTHISNKKILKDRAVKYATELELPSLLASAAIRAGGIAALRYNLSIGNKEEFHAKTYEDLKEDLSVQFPGFVNAEFVKGKRNAETPVRKSERAGVIFDIGRIGSHLKKHTDNFVGELPPILIAATLEIITIAIFNEAVKQLKKRKTVSSRDIMIGIYKDEELHKMFKNYVIMDTGVPQGMYYEGIF